jgi:hypothetical protein
MNRERELGFVNIKTILVLAILGAAVYTGVKVVPLYFANYQLQDKMKEVAKFALANRQTEADLRNAVYKEAQDQDVPINPEDIRVEMGPQGPFISADYKVNVDLQVYQFTLEFKPNSAP